MSLIPQAFHLTFRNAWVSIGKLSYIICQNTYFFTFVKTNHYVEDQIRKYDNLVSQYKKIVSDKFYFTVFMNISILSETGTADLEECLPTSFC